MSVMPSGPINFSDIKNALNSQNNSLLGFRGTNQTLPSSGSIGMSNAYRLVKGVGYNSNTYSPVYNTLIGTWSQTGITNLSSMTVSFIITISNTNPAWRSVFHVTTGSDDSTRRPAIWITPDTTRLHIKSSTNVNLNEGDDTSPIPMNQETHVVIVYNGQNRKTYFNKVLNQDFNFAGTITNNSGTEGIYSASPHYSTTGGFTMRRLWFYPYPMTATQVNALSA